MEHEMEIVVEIEDDALPEAPNIHDPLALHAVERWLNAAEEKRALEPDVEERLAVDPALQRFYVDGDIGKFWHATRVEARGKSRKLRAERSAPKEAR
jgi:hypothetical protein